MNKKRLFFLLLILIVSALNLYIILNRNNGFKYFPYKTYSQLYITDSSLYLKDLRFDSDSLQISFSLKLPASSYSLYIDDTLSAVVKPSATSLAFPLKDNIHYYRLVPQNIRSSEIVFQVDHDETKTPVINEFLYCNLPGPHIKVSPYNTWSKGIESFDKKEIEDGKKWLERHTNLSSAATDSARLLEICRAIAPLRPNAKGINATEAAALGPYQQLKLAAENKINLDCGNYSGFIYFLCSVAEIPNRLITFSGPAGNWRYGVHYYNEIYLREKQQWVLCDGLNNSYMPHDSTRFYNAVDVNKIARVNGATNKYVYTFINGSVASVPYDSINYWHKYYNRSNADIRFLHPGVRGSESKWTYLLDFYTFNRNFGLYSDINSNDWRKIVAKQILFYLLLFILICYTCWEISRYLKRTKSRRFPSTLH